MDKSIFREKSIERVTSPEELNDYMKVTTPKVWIVLIAVLIFLIGALTWAFGGSVTVTDDYGNQQEIHPISYIIN